MTPPGPQEEHDLYVIIERLNNFMRESLHDRQQLHEDIESLRQQTHDWMQAMLNRLPTWAVAIGSALWGVVGAMAMWIVTHLSR